ncbi:MAG: 30S ribosome-binding factor RbfA [Cyclobacteriaceae bacterium]|nr:30S ribosome-binding factor RbfA [Cyclobacteriaceae bacterium]
MNESKRQQKVAKLLQKDLGDIFQRDTRGILDGAFVTIADVQITPDLSIAFVNISMMMVKDKEALIEKINDRKSEIRRELGNKIGKQVRIIPNLKFFVDQVQENANRMDKIIDQLNIPPAKDEDNETL